MKRVFKKMLRSVVSANTAVSSWASRFVARLNGRRSGRHEFVEKILPSLLKPGSRVLDVGGGKWPVIDVLQRERQ
jgi:hypothetical protein